MASIRSLWPAMADRTLLMGVLNVTPDSFSDGRPADGAADAVRRGVALARAGADLIDVGGESTRPGAPIVSLAEELDRVLPVITGLIEAGVDRISIDTTKAEVARRAVSAGACLVNDISALTFDPDMAAVVADSGAALVLSHTRDRPDVMQSGKLDYAGGVVSVVCRSLAASMTVATKAGVSADALLLDPGIGFGKTVDQNFELLRAIRDIEAVGAPVLVGTSRKSFIGEITGRAVDQREFGTAATVALAIQAGAAIVRVHDVANMIDVVRVADAWCRLVRLAQIRSD